MTCLLPDDGHSCIRLRGKDGDYLTLLPCGVNPDTKEVTCVDLCLPSGEVLWCGIDIELVNIFAERLGIEEE